MYSTMFTPARHEKSRLLLGNLTDNNGLFKFYLLKEFGPHVLAKALSSLLTTECAVTTVLD